MVNIKNSKISELQNEKLSDMRRLKEVKEKLDSQIAQNDQLSDRIHELERKNEETSKLLISSNFVI